MRFIFATLPLPGHLNPLVPVARAAQGRGHVVAIASAPAYRKRIERMGFEAISVGVDWSEPEIAEVAQEAMRRNSDQYFVSKLFARTVAPRVIPDMHRAIGEWRPDVVVRESTEFASAIAAETHGIPWATVCFGHERTSDQWLEALDGELNPLRTLSELDPDQSGESLGRYLNLVFAPPGYQPPGKPLGRTSHLIRPVLNEGQDQALPSWLHELPAQPTINGTLGTVFNKTPGLFEAMIDAIRDRPWNLVLTVGRNRDQSEFEPLPDNVRVAQFIPQSQLLNRCDVLVAHAGYGTTMAGIAGGVPMVLIPLGADQPGHAESCSRLGVARVLQVSQVSPSSLERELEQVLGDPAYTLRAATLRGQLEELPPVERSVELLETLARSQQPLSRE